jgi:hypothetical protein
MTARFGAIAVMVAVLGGRADAQELAGDLNQLRALVKPGDGLTVTDTDGKRVKGKLTQLDDLRIVLEVRDRRGVVVTNCCEFDGHTIATIKKRDHLWNGALIGFAAGVGAGALWGLAAQDIYILLGTPLPFGGIGAVVGAVIDARSQREIYAKSRTTVSVAPVIDRHRKGVVFTLRR